MRRAALLLLVVLAGCGGSDAEEPPQRTSELQVETVVGGLEVPWELVFLPDGRALVTERPGRIRLLDQDMRLQPEPVAEVDTSAQGEGGLMGLTLDPEFAGNGLLYLFFTTAEGLKLERWHFADDRLTREQDLIAGTIEAGPVHDSGRIHMGPDKRLYVATGDAGEAQLAQDPDSLNGKFLAITPEQYHGDAASRPAIISVGHRNPQGFDWQPGTGRLIATEHGPSGFDGPQGLDEINAIEEGGNYGWPEAMGEDHDGFDAPLKVYEEAIAPSGATFVEAEGSPWQGDLIFAALRGEALHRLRFDGNRITEDEVLLEGEYGRFRQVVEGPDGALYALTSNRDGRGSPADDDDRILRIRPPQ
jgi:glucose/arabinose dehydrogenase